MNIALVSAYDFAYPGGVTTHIAKLDEHFQRLGHKVTILAPSSKSAQELGLPNLKVVGRWPVPFPSGGSAARVTISPWLARPVKQILRENAFDIIHIHEPLLPALPLTVLRFSQAVNVGTFHACHTSSRGYLYSRPILKGYFRRLHGKIAVSSAAMEFINRYFPGSYNIIPNGIDLEHFTPDKPPLTEYADEKLNVLFVGRLEKRKGLQHLLGAWRYVQARLPQARLLIVGPEGRARPEYESLAHHYGLKDVVFAGQVPYQKLPRYYSSAHVFCSPATGDESFGVVLLEAMASARPIVASQIPGYACVMSDGQEGFLVPPGDEAALAQALVRLLESHPLRQRLGSQGQARAQEFSWKEVAHRVLDYYQGLLSERATAGAVAP